MIEQKRGIISLLLKNWWVNLMLLLQLLENLLVEMSGERKAEQI
jgi:hypothetical protein